MSTSLTGVQEKQDVDGRMIIVALNGVPLIIRVYSPERYSSALNDARFVATQVSHGDMHWADGIALLTVRSRYYSAMPKMKQSHAAAQSTVETKAAHLRDATISFGKLVWNMPAVMYHYAHAHLPRFHGTVE